MVNKKSRKGQKPNPWSLQDEEVLIKNIKKNVTNLTKAFKQTSQEIQRTPTACSAHWYANTSVKSGHVLFLTCSGKHIAINRKNGKGKPLSVPLYKKVLALFGLNY